MTTSYLVELFQNLQVIEKVADNYYRSNPPHMNGSLLLLKTVFGGQLVAQTYLVAKKVSSNMCISKMHFMYINPAVAKLPIEFFIEVFDSNQSFCVLAKQQEKLILKCIIALDLPVNLLKNLCLTFPKNVALPKDCIELVKLAEDGRIGPKTSQEHRNYVNMLKNSIFELYPVDFLHFTGNLRKTDPLLIWCRILPSFKSVEMVDPMFVIMLLTDFLVFQPVKSLHFTFNRLKEFVTGSSLNHKIHIFHHNVDPYAYFLCEIDSEIISQNRPLITGQIYDEQKRLVATFVQEGFMQPPVGSSDS